MTTSETDDVTMSSSSSIEAFLNKPAIPVKDFFAAEKARHVDQADLQALVDTLDALYTQKLYHQLTEKLIAYIEEAGLSGLQTVALLYHVAFPLKQKLNLVTIVDLVRQTAERLEIEDALRLIATFEPVVIDCVDPKAQLATVKANVYTRAGRLTEAEELLFTELAPGLQARIGVDLWVNSAFYEASTNYFRATRNAREFYESLLLYLAYTPINRILKQAELAFELCVAGLLGEGMFDFADLRTTEILRALEEDVERKWILDFVDAAVEGNLRMFQTACTTYAARVEETFGDKIATLKEKMNLAALIELAFQQPKASRSIAMQQIADHCGISVDEGDRLVMCAISLGLIKGQIDNVTSRLHLTWVKPRIVDSQRIHLLRNRFLAWSESVKQLATHLQNITPDVLVS